MDKRKHDAYQKSRVRGDNYVIATTDPKLRGRINTNITDPEGAVYWYIRFNVALNPDTVSKYTMNITDMKGYILNSIITYDVTRNLIVLNPMDLYRQNEYYVLNISKKVQSAGGKSLPKSAHILFKIINNELSDFEILKSTAHIPKPRKKPASMRRDEVRELVKSKTFTPAVEAKKSVGSPTLPYGPLNIKLGWPILGLIVMGLTLLSGTTAIIVGGMAAAIAGLLQLLFQLRTKKVQSAINYLHGVSRFNRGKYKKAAEPLKKAANLDPDNELAEYAAGKVQFYL